MNRFLKCLICLLFLASGVCDLQADDTEVPIVIKKRKETGEGGSNRGKAPMYLPIDVTFNNVGGTLSVTAPEDLEGCVFVYSITGAQEATSPQLNCTLIVPQTSDIHVISLQGETWIGEAKLVY